jgi:Kdo2-lipid IVA lauroyltransferase/acyltransferase
MMSLLARLPLSVLHALGAALAWTVYGFAPRWRARLRANLAQAGYTGARLRRAVVAESGRMLLESPKLWLRPRAEILSLVRRVEGLELAERARAAGKGIVYLTPHYGCWEITPHVAAEQGPLTVLYRPPKDEGLLQMMQAGRARHNVSLARADLGGVRVLLAALKRGEAIGILPDQVPGKGEGEWVPFFGRPAYTMTLAAKLIERPGVVCILAMGRRLARGAGYEVRFLPLAQARPGESSVRRINRAIEEAVRENPEQYLWSYNRYKRPAGAPPPPAEPQ